MYVYDFVYNVHKFQRQTLMFTAWLYKCYSDVYLNKKLELDKAEADVAKFVNTTLNLVTYITHFRHTVIFVMSLVHRI